MRGPARLRLDWDANAYRQPHPEREQTRDDRDAARRRSGGIGPLTYHAEWWPTRTSHRSWGRDGWRRELSGCWHACLNAISRGVPNLSGRGLIKILLHILTLCDQVVFRQQAAIVRPLSSFGLSARSSWALICARNPVPFAAVTALDKRSFTRAR